MCIGKLPSIVNDVYDNDTAFPAADVEKVTDANVRGGW